MAIEAKNRSATQLSRTPVSIRLSAALAPEVARRLSDQDASAVIIRRDLQRYYAGCSEALKRLNYDYQEANTLIDLLRNTTLTAENARFLWAELDEQLRRGRNWTEGTPDYDRALELIEAIKKISPFDCIAILDAVESCWSIYSRNGQDRDDALAECGLTTEHLFWEEQRAAQEKRDTEVQYDDHPEHGDADK